MGSDPGYRVSHMTVARKQVTMCDEQVRHGANTGISYNIHAFVPRRRFGVIHLKRAFFGADRVRCGVGEGYKVIVGSSRIRELVGSTATDLTSPGRRWRKQTAEHQQTRGHGHDLGLPKPMETAGNRRLLVEAEPRRGRRWPGELGGGRPLSDEVAAARHGSAREAAGQHGGLHSRRPCGSREARRASKRAVARGLVELGGGSRNPAEKRPQGRRGWRGRARRAAQSNKTQRGGGQATRRRRTGEGKVEMVQGRLGRQCGRHGRMRGGSGEFLRAFRAGQGRDAR
ncbi:hypothetical protein TRIUR3_26662 [Triticum urartu]|uniref:Uncharacterized protein n=1 Tax=Triticum urartu TaxID=4572 RepID=M7ZC40_TRIUA|nr:hypothetical protein TRIUR3_26662 [Triticum urartu]